MDGIETIAGELRTLTEEWGWTISHNIAEFPGGELVSMAGCYMALAKVQTAKGTLELVSNQTPRNWPKDVDTRWWKPSVFPKVNLGRAAALLAAEWDRLHSTGG
jgi:hypothetical protein